MPSLAHLPHIKVVLVLPSREYSSFLLDAQPQLLEPHGMQQNTSYVAANIRLDVALPARLINLLRWYSMKSADESFCKGCLLQCTHSVAVGLRMRI